MKINTGFVTNSSSTSFVVCVKKTLTEKGFIKSFGLTEESLMYDFYAKLYYAVNLEKKPIPRNVNLKNFLNEHSINIDDEKDYKEIERRFLAGENVYYGKLSDSGDYGGLSEAFYALESVIVIDNDFYFNAKDCAY